MRIREALFAFALAGCMDRPLGAVYPVQGKVENLEVPANPEKDVDILFLIDSSGSMLAEQASLQASFPKFMQVLETLPGGAPNMHIGVATPDMGQKATDGIGTTAAGGCSGSGENGALRTSASIAGKYIIDEESGGTRNRNYTGTLGEAFSSIAAVGSDGCGIEQHLAAVEATLKNPANAGFIRPEAKLAVIVIADEDDCSLAHHNLFENNVDGTVLNFRCTRSGITCSDNPDLTQPGLRTMCQPNDQSQYLEPVDRYVDFIKQLKPSWRDDVIVAGVVGKNDPFEIKMNERNLPILAPSCTYDGNQTAVPALRTSDFLAQFQYTTQKEICTADLTPAMVEIAALLKRSIGERCFQSEVIDLDPNTEGLQADCTVSDWRQLPDGSEKEIDLIPNCSFNEIPCWRIEVDPVECHYTTTHQKLVVERGGAIPAADIEVRASCVTKTNDGPVM